MVAVEARAAEVAVVEARAAEVAGVEAKAVEVAGEGLRRRRLRPWLQMRSWRLWRLRWWRLRRLHRTMLDMDSIRLGSHLLG